MRCIKRKFQQEAHNRPNNIRLLEQQSGILITNVQYLLANSVFMSTSLWHLAHVWKVQIFPKTFSLRINSLSFNDVDFVWECRPVKSPFRIRWSWAWCLWNICKRLTAPAVQINKKNKANFILFFFLMMVNWSNSFFYIRFWWQKLMELLCNKTHVLEQWLPKINAQIGLLTI